jgi:hypothetical protein
MKTKEEAINEVERNADAVWLGAARTVISQLARRRTHLTSDDIWDQMEQPREPRAMGAVFRWAVREGIVEITDRTKVSRRPECHGRRIQVWRSRKCRAA